MEASGGGWGRFSRRSFIKKALVIPFAAPVVASFTMDNVSAQPGQSHPHGHAFGHP
jgi:hypothetical protein